MGAKKIVLTCEFNCRSCQNRFELPVPRGPGEEKKLSCPRCGSRDIARIKSGEYSAPPCGG
jgi:DNA-directed RNA polymerase subunit RPC12/RpoP